MIDASCQCGAHYRVPEKLAGKRLKCKKCAGPIDIPVPEPPEADDAFVVDVLADEPVIRQDAVIAGPTAAAAPAGASSRSAPFEPSHLPAYLKDCVASLMFFAESGNLLPFLVVAAIVMLQPILLYGMCIGLVAWIIVFGWKLSFLFNVMLNAANGERDLPELTLIEGPVETIVVPCFKYLAAGVAVFWPVVVFGGFNPEAVEQGEPIFWLVIAACLFFWPMAMLMVGVGGVSSFVRVDLMIRTLIRTFVPYFLVCVLSAGVFTASWYINKSLISSGGKASEHPIALVCVLQVLELYFWVLVMRFIGLYYHHFKSRFAWTWG